RTSANMNNGYFGARVPVDGQVISEVHLDSPMPNYTQVTVNFNSGPHNFVEVFAGIWANGDTWLQLDDASLTRSANLVGHAGFEQQPSSSVSSPWFLLGNGGIDLNLGYARTGQDNGFVRWDSGWNAMKQEIFVEPNTSYTLKAWLKSSNNMNNGYFGVRG